jgi:hypothetical protein
MDEQCRDREKIGQRTKNEDMQNRETQQSDCITNVITGFSDY